MNANRLAREAAKRGAAKRHTGQGENATAFTTIELLVVIGTLVLLLAMAVPAFNYIMGNRSTEAAENIVSAMLGRARGYAIANQCYCGVGFFYNPVTERTTMGLVYAKSPGSGGTEDPYDNYKGWSGVLNDGTGNSPQYAQGDAVIMAAPNGAEGKVLVSAYYTSIAGTTAMPPVKPPWYPMGASASSMANGYIDLLPDTDLEALPPGVRAQLINSPNVPAYIPDRYVHTGAIMFDPAGALACVPLLIPQGSQLAALVQNQPDPTKQVKIPANDLRVNQFHYFTSQLGLVLYGRDEFVGAGGVDPDFANGKAEDQCLMLTPNPSDQQMRTEEDWLDKNTQVLMVSRYNGTLIKGE